MDYESIKPYINQAVMVHFNNGTVVGGLIPSSTSNSCIFVKTEDKPEYLTSLDPIYENEILLKDIHHIEHVIEN